MESLWKLTSMLEPASLVLILIDVFVTFASASRALDHGKEMKRNLDFSEASITLDRSPTLMIPLVSSFNLLLMFYLFFSVSHLVTAFIAVASVSALFFCFFPYVAYLKTQLGLMNPFVFRCLSKSFTRSQGILLLLCVGTVVAWLVSGNWMLKNRLEICMCTAFSHAYLPIAQH